MVCPIHYSIETPEVNHRSIEICIVNALQLAMQMNAKTVCIPSISTGGAMFPMDMVATLIIETCANWASLHETGNIALIKVCNYDREENEVYRRVFNQIKVSM